MGGVNSRDRQQNKIGDRIDKSLEFERKEGISPSDKLALLEREYQEYYKNKSFDDLYDTYAKWETQVANKLEFHRGMPYLQLNDQMGTTKLAAKNWCIQHYKNRVDPAKMARMIKDILY